MSRRDEILEAATRIALAEGVDGVSVRRVASAAGIGPTTLRHYFATQVELLHAVAQSLAVQTTEDGDIADPSAPPADRLLRRLEQFIPSDEAQRAALAGWFELQRIALGTAPDDVVGPFLRGAHAAGRESIARWLQALAGEGHVDPAEIDVHVTGLLAFLDGLALHMVTDTGADDTVRARQSLRWFVERSVLR